MVLKSQQNIDRMYRCNEHNNMRYNNNKIYQRVNENNNRQIGNVLQCVKTKDNLCAQN